MSVEIVGENKNVYYIPMSSSITLNKTLNEVILTYPVTNIHPFHFFSSEQYMKHIT